MSTPIDPQTTPTTLDHLLGTGSAGRDDEADHQVQSEDVEPQNVEDTDDSTEDEADDSPGDDQHSGRREARYRVQLREVEAERDQLAGELAGARRTIAESLSGLRKPAALWAVGTKVEDLLGEDGSIDRAKVDAAVQVTVDTLGINRGPRPDKTQGFGGGIPDRKRATVQDVIWQDTGDPRGGSPNSGPSQTDEVARSFQDWLAQPKTR